MNIFNENILFMNILFINTAFLHIFLNMKSSYECIILMNNNNLMKIYIYNNSPYSRIYPYEYIFIMVLKAPHSASQFPLLLSLRFLSLTNKKTVEKFSKCYQKIKMKTKTK